MNRERSPTDESDVPDNTKIHQIQSAFLHTRTKQGSEHLHDMENKKQTEEND
jgi:hypothetical protein